MIGKRGILLFTTIILLLSISLSSSKQLIKKDIINKQFSEDDSVLMNIVTERPVVTYSDGLTSLFDYKFKKVNDNWEVMYCHKDYKKNYQDKLQKEKNKFKKIKVKTKKGSPNIPSEIDMDSKCSSFLFQGNKHDSIQIDDKSTVIEILDSNVTFEIYPEDKYCSYLYCISEIRLINKNNYSITINSSDLSVEINSKNYWVDFDYTYIATGELYNYTCLDSNDDYISNINYTQDLCSYVNSLTIDSQYTEVTDIDEGKKITILPDELKIFYLHSVMDNEDSLFKYNVSLFYINQTYDIDPYFYTINSTFNNGVYNQTFLNESGFVQLNSSFFNGTYYSEIFDAKQIVSWNNISWYSSELGPYYVQKDVGCENVLLLYHLDENVSTGQTVYDYSCDMNNGTTSFTGSATCVNQSGIFNLSCYFDGGSDYIQASKSDDYYSDINFTATAWVTVGNLNPSKRKIVLARWLTNKKNFQLGLNTNNQFYFNTYSTCDSAHTELATTMTASTDRWYCVSYQLEKGIAKRIYVNGNLEASSGILASIPSGCGDYFITVGAHLGNLQTSWDGKIDEVIIHNRTLDEDEIKDICKRGATRLNLTLRSCDDSSCDTESWIDVEEDSPLDLSVSDNRYFQYRFDFFTKILNISPLLYNVTINYNESFTNLKGIFFNIDNFNVTEENYTIKKVVYFNTTHNSKFLLLNTLNILKLTSNMSNDVFSMVKVDDNVILDEKIRSVSQVGDEGVSALSSTKFNVSLGVHNITIYYRRTGNGIVEINDIDFAFLQDMTSENNSVDCFIQNGVFSHSSNTFTPSLNFTFNKSIFSESFVVTGQKVSSASEGTVYYYVENRDSLNISPYYGRYISSATDTGSVCGLYIDGYSVGSVNYTIQSKSLNSTTIDNNYTIFALGLNDNETIQVHHFSSTNNETNLTSSKTYSSGSNKILEKTITAKSDSYFLAFTSTFNSLSGIQTPRYILNSTDSAINCYSKKERYLESNVDVGNLFIYTVCDNITLNQDYTFTVYLENTGTIEQLDENLVGISLEQISVSECIPNWVPNYGPCLVNDSQLKYYTDTNNCGNNIGLPLDNNTYIYCNYCSEDITGPFFVPADCPESQQQLRYYVDLNYSTCCNVTGLYTDCSILYSPYTNQTINCSYLETEITIYEEENPYLHDRNYFLGEINISNSTKCWSYVKKEDKILQTSPQKTGYSESIIFRKKIETREYFTPVQGKVNSYYTDQNIIPYERYVLGLRCVLDNTTILNGEKFITPIYDDLRRVSSRAVWGVQEVIILIIVSVIILIILLWLILAWRK